MKFYLREDLKTALAPKNSFQDILSLDGVTYRHVKNRHTFSFERGEKTYFIKIHLGVGWKEIIKNLIRGKIPVLGAKNEWWAIQKCEHLNIETMAIAGYGSKGIYPPQLSSFLITDALTHIETLEDFCPRYFCSEQLDAKHLKLKEKIIVKIAEIARKLHSQNITHHDMYICHFLLNISTDVFSVDDITLYLIDLHRAQKHSFFKHRYIIKDLAAIYFSSMDLYISSQDKKLFMETYRQKPFRWIQENEKKMWQQVEQKAIKLYQKIHKKNPVLTNE